MITLKPQNLQNLIDQHGGVRLRPGVHRWHDVVKLKHGQRLIAPEGAILECRGIEIEPPANASYAKVEVAGVELRGTGEAIGLNVRHGWAKVQDVTVKGFETGLRVEYAIRSRYQDVILSENEVGLLIEGQANMPSTTLAFVDFVSRQADVAIRVRGPVINVVFERGYMESSRRGVEIDGVRVAAFRDWYAENIAEEHIVAGFNAPVGSLVLDNPTFINGTANIAAKDMVALDQVESFAWLYGAAQMARAATVRTTARTGRVEYHEPIHSGVFPQFTNLEKSPQFLLNGRIAVQRVVFQSSYGSVVQSVGYNQEPHDMTWGDPATGELIASIRRDGTGQFKRVLMLDEGTNTWRRMKLVNGQLVPA